MTPLRRSIGPVACLVAALGLGAAAPASPAEPGAYSPKAYQSGKDVVWLPTHEALVEQMLDMVQLTPEDSLVDLGSGDGITVIKAAKRGARAHGIEFNPKLVELSKRNAKEAGVADRATFVQADIFKSDFSKATVVSLFLLPELNLRLRPTLLKMKPGTRIVSNTFDMGEWKADRSVPRVRTCQDYCTAYMWTVPAQVAGTWTMGNREMQIKQRFQMLEGTVGSGPETQDLREAKLDGVNIAFDLGGERYLGEVQRDVMRGTRGDGTAWEAMRRR